MEGLGHHFKIKPNPIAAMLGDSELQGLYFAYFFKCSPGLPVNPEAPQCLVSEHSIAAALNRACIEYRRRTGRLVYPGACGVQVEV